MTGTIRDHDGKEITFRQLVDMRTRKHEGMAGEDLTVSHSSLAGGSCRRRFMFYKILQMSRRSDNYAGDVGNTMHEAYQTFLITGNERAGLEKLVLTYPYRYAKSAFDQRSPEACVQAYEKLVEKHHQYYSNYQLARIKDADGNEIPAIEVPFEIRLFLAGERVTLYDRPVSYIGYIDSIFHSIVEQGSYHVQDLKTTTKNRKSYEAMWKFEEQTLPYQFVLSNILGAELNEFYTDIFCAFIDPLNPRVEHIPLVRTAAHVRDWARGLYLELQIMQQCASHDWWPRNGKQCDTWSVCPYFDVCEKPEDKALTDYMGFDADGWPFPPVSGRGEWKPLFVLNLDLQE